MITINVMVRGTGSAGYWIHVLSDNPKLKPDMQGSDGSKRAGIETAVTEVDVIIKCAETSSCV
jgi:hypothetical protein